MEKFQYTSVNNILAKFHRDFRGLDVSETDAIEWIGDALGFMKIASNAEEAIAFVEVKNHQVELPNSLHYIIQVAKNTKYVPEEQNVIPEQVINCLIEEEVVAEDVPITVDCQGKLQGDVEIAYYRPYFDLVGEYYGWRNSRYYQEDYVPVRLSNHSFFNSLVCQDPTDAEIYSSRCESDDEYTVIAGNTLRFSFKEGFVAIAYLRQRMDDNGYPMIPDDMYARNAVTYYMTWMIKQRECYMHREGACQLADKAQTQWNSYIKKFKNKAKMPHGLDQYQNLAESSRYLIPRHNRYYGFFGKLGKMEDRPFNYPKRRFNIYIGNNIGNR